MERSFNRKAVASSHRRISRPIETAQPLCGWASTELVTQGSRSGNPGLEDATALRFVAEAKRLRLTRNSSGAFATDRVNCLPSGRGFYIVDGRAKSKPPTAAAGKTTSLSNSSDARF